MESHSQKTQQPRANINLNIETTPIMFADNIFWNISDNAVVLNFGQQIMGLNQVKIIARVGLSKVFAKRFLNDIEKNIALTEAQGQTGKASQTGKAKS